MSSPRAIIQIFITGSRILGKAFYEAGRQAVKNAKQSPHSALGSEADGVGHATSGSVTDHLTRQHRLTLDEAQLILNVKREEGMEKMLQNYEHLFKTNAPLPKPEKPTSGKQIQPVYSHYLQSKVVRARERLEAELKAAAEPAAPETSQQASSSPSPSTGSQSASGRS